MKLHVGINLFNGEEFLEAQLCNLREHADFITVVWQSVSFAGNAADPGLHSLLLRLRKQGYIDRLAHHEPDFSLRGEANETVKRNAGLAVAKSLGATHHMDRDVDEFFFSEQLAAAKRLIVLNGYDTTACRIYEYHKEPIYREKQVRPGLYAPLIHRIYPDSRYELEWPFYPVRIDPTRRITPFRNFHCFDETVICMEHFTLVRRDLDKCKLRDALNRRPNLEWRLNAVREFDPARYDKVENYFNIKL